MIKDFSTWFVVPIVGPSNTHLLVKAADKVSALAVILFRRPELKPKPVQTFEQYCADRNIDPANELQYALGIVNPATIVTGTITLMP